MLEGHVRGNGRSEVPCHGLSKATMRLASDFAAVPNG